MCAIAHSRLCGDYDTILISFFLHFFFVSKFFLSIILLIKIIIFIYIYIYI